MSSKNKLAERFKSTPKDFTWNELVRLLVNLGFEERSSGKTSGSGRKFFNPQTSLVINLHKPHPSSIIKPYMVKQIMLKLIEEKLL